MRRWIWAVALGLLGLVALVWAGVYSNGLSRYSTSEGVSRLASGYTHMKSTDFKNIGGALATTTIGAAAAMTDTSDHIWWNVSLTPDRARHGKIARFPSFHVAKWRWMTTGNTSFDGPCTLYVFAGGRAATVTNGAITGAADTLVWPFPGINMANPASNLVMPEWHDVSLDSVVFAPAETLYAVSVYAVGDTF